MKKLFICMGLCALVALGSCKSEEKKAAETEATDNTEAAASAPEQPKANDFIANLQATDSTVQVTPSGLGYKIIKQTRGVTPSTDATVMVKYTGKHTDGSVFDSSNDQAVEFPLGQVIPGFREGISMMPMGSTYEFYIPADLGYGQRGVPGVIQPGETLIFEVELVDIK